MSMWNSVTLSQECVDVSNDIYYFLFQTLTLPSKYQSYIANLHVLSDTVTKHGNTLAYGLLASARAHKQILFSIQDDNLSFKICYRTLTV